MNLPTSRFKLFTFFLGFIALVFSCTKIATTDIGSDLLPPVDGVTTKDTVLDIITKNSDYDTVSVGISDDHVLGYIDDKDNFGTTTASLNFQVAPTSIPFSWGIDKSDITVDSVVLCLSYTSAWGDTLPSSPLKLHVYKMDPEVIFTGDTLYNNNISFEKADELTENDSPKVVDISSLDDVGITDSVYDEPTTNQLRIRLNKSFGELLVSYDSATVYNSASTFYNYLRGLIVEPENTGNALMRINLLDTTTHLSVYYHGKLTADTLTRRFSPDVSTSASSNTILRNYEAGQIPSYIPGTSTNDDLIFMQTSPGIYATLKIPGITGLRNMIVHRAEVLMYQVPDLKSDNDQYLTPPNLFLSAYSPDSNHRFAIPYDITILTNSITNLIQFGVAPKAQIDKNTGRNTVFYSFDISRYVQGIVTRQDTAYDLILQAPYNQYIYPAETAIYPVPISTPALNTAGIGSVKLGGGSNADYKMRLHIVYSLP
jgi:Domain of unknown function (DUF4270)